MHILLTNDDGINAEGLVVLKNYLKKENNIQVSIIAPSSEQSSTGHKITTAFNPKPLIINKIEKDMYSLSGSPADCVRIGLYQLFKNVDLVISGINHGANLGMDIYYSGTIAAARESCFYGVPSFAVSLYKNQTNDPLQFLTACIYIKQFIKQFHKKIPKSIYLNINFPNLEAEKIKGVKVCKLEENTFYNIEIIERQSPLKQNYYWVHGKPNYTNSKPETDINYITNNFITITPLKLDNTAVNYISLFEDEIKTINME